MVSLPQDASSWFRELQERGALHNLVVERTSEGVWVMDAHTKTVFVNEQLAAMLGHSAEELLYKPAFAFLDEEGRAQAASYLDPRTADSCEQREFKFRRKDGSALWALLATRALRDREGRQVGVLAMLSDLTARKEMERLVIEARRELEERVAERTRELLEENRRLAELAAHDPLTGLLNRRSLHERLEQEVARATRHGGTLSALVVDVDDFKHINDSAGHQAGDAVLRQLASWLLDMVRESDVVARYGGEEFVVLAPETPRPGALCLAERMRERVAASRCKARHWSGNVTVSIGVSTLDSASVAADVIIQQADAAMYEAKKHGKNRVWG